MDWADILVVLLAFLAVTFLIVAFALVFLLIKLTRQIKSTTKSAEQTLHTIEDSVGPFNRRAISVMMTKRIMSQVKKRAQKKDMKTKGK